MSEQSATDQYIGVKNLLTPDNHALVLIDHQYPQLLSVTSHKHSTVSHNVTAQRVTTCAAAASSTVCPKQRQLCRQLRRLAGPFNQLFWSRRFIPGHLEPHRRQHKLL